MSVLPLDPSSTEPPFEQLRRQVATRVARGDLAAGTKLPTVRGLATELGLSAGTVARAYKELEADGVVVTEGRRGTFVRSSGAASSPGAAAAAATYAAEARRLTDPLTGSATREPEPVPLDRVVGLLVAVPVGQHPADAEATGLHGAAAHREAGAPLAR